MMGGVRELVTMLSEPKLVITEVREKAQIIDEAESLADRLCRSLNHLRLASAAFMAFNHGLLTMLAGGATTVFEIPFWVILRSHQMAKAMISIARRPSGSSRLSRVRAVT